LLFALILTEQQLLIEEEVTFFNASSSIKVKRRSTGAIIHVAVRSL